MKKHLVILMIVTLMAIVVTSCTKEEVNSLQNPADAVSGIYKGTLTASDNTEEPRDTKVYVDRIDESSVQINMTNTLIDTAFILNLYPNGDSMMVCLGGEDFYHQYGHDLDEEHHMMDENDQMNWDHHMEEQHDAGDVHFGGFDMEHHSFSYRIFPQEQSDVYYQFEGVKE